MEGLRSCGSNAARSVMVQYSKAQLHGGRSLDLVLAKASGYFVAVFIAISACLYAAAAAQDNVAVSPSELDFDIPSQSLESALQAEIALEQDGRIRKRPKDIRNELVRLSGLL